jgi:hypothetical protein
LIEKRLRERATGMLIGVFAQPLLDQRRTLRVRPARVAGVRCMLVDALSGALLSSKA